MLLSSQIDPLIDAALAEDIGLGDATTMAVVAPEARGTAQVLAREALVLAGFDVFARVFQRLDPTLTVTARGADGTTFAAGTTVATLAGALAPILSAERVALNFLQRLCGIATLTKTYVDALPPSSTTVVVDTRKTTPGLRALERYAVRCGGGHNHRPRLDGGILMKENHIAAAGSITAALRRARATQGPALRLEIEVSSLGQVEEALAAGAEVIMLDNMSLADARRAVELIAGRALIEVSGGVHHESIAAIAALGVDYISVGALTHSARAIDLSLLVDPC